MDKAECGCPTDGEFTYHQNSVCLPLPPPCPSCAEKNARILELEAIESRAGNFVEIAIILCGGMECWKGRSEGWRDGYKNDARAISDYLLRKEGR